MDSVTRAVPYDIEAERAVLGSLLLEREAILKTEPFLAASDFYMEMHGWVYQAVLDLLRRREPPDLVTLSSELARRPVGRTAQTQLDAIGGLAYLSQLMHDVPTWVHIVFYAEAVEECSRRRAAITMAGTIAGMAYDRATPLPETMERMERACLAVTQRNKRGVPDKTLQGAMAAYLTDLADRMDGARPVPGWTTGLTELDNLLGGGFRAGKVYVPLGVPGGGKTTFGMSVALAALEAGARLGVYSLEMGEDELAEMALAHDARVDSLLLQAGTVTDAEWQAVNAAYRRRAGQAPFRIVAGGGFTYRDIAAQARAWQVDGGLDMLIIDYLGLVRTAGKSGEKVNELDTLITDLKGLAMELHVPLIIPSQISREGRTADPNDWKQFTRGTGGIEQAADVVLAVAPEGDKPGDPRDPWPMKIYVSKQRRGPTGVVDADWYLAYNRITDEPRAQYV